MSRLTIIDLFILDLIENKKWFGADDDNNNTGTYSILIEIDGMVQLTRLNLPFAKKMFPIVRLVWLFDVIKMEPNSCCLCS